MAKIIAVEEILGQARELATALGTKPGAEFGELLLSEIRAHSVESVIHVDDPRLRLTPKYKDRIREEVASQNGRVEFLQ